MALDQHASNLITTTINAFNGEVTNISPMDGISLIDSWLSALRATDQQANPVTNGLSDLKAELQSGNPDSNQISQILGELVDQVQTAADSAETDVQTRLNALVEALQGFSDQMSGKAGPAKTGGQAPMTSTVGGESTNSGAGASAFGTRNDDDLSNRSTGGTVSTNYSAMGMDDPTGSDGGSGGMDPAADDSADRNTDADTTRSAGGMDDPTGSDGDQPQDGGSYGSGYGTGSEGDDYTANSGTQRSGVSGSSTSSGSGDTDTGSSGGRSQY